MRIKKRGSGGAMQEGDMTPMIDMVFQLIAFFMVLVNFTEADIDDRVVLPESVLAKPPESSPEDFLTVQMTETGDVIVDGRVETVDNVYVPLSRRADYFQRTGRAIDDVVVIIRAHHKAPTGKVQKLIQECQRAKFERFVLRAKEKVPGAS